MSTTKLINMIAHIIVGLDIPFLDAVMSVNIFIVLTINNIITDIVNFVTNIAL